MGEPKNCPGDSKLGSGPTWPCELSGFVGLQTEGPSPCLAARSKVTGIYSCSSNFDEYLFTTPPPHSLSVRRCPFRTEETPAQRAYRAAFVLFPAENQVSKLVRDSFSPINLSFRLGLVSIDFGILLLGLYLFN